MAEDQLHDLLFLVFCGGTTAQVRLIQRVRSPKVRVKNLDIQFVNSLRRHVHAENIITLFMPIYTVHVGFSIQCGDLGGGHK